MWNSSFRHIWYGISVSVCLSLNPAHAGLPTLADSQQHIYAWVPSAEAATAGVAQAKVHILLSKARRAAEAELCQGHWNIHPGLQGSSPPLKAKAPQLLGGHVGWYYEIKGPALQLTSCPGIQPQQFHQAMSHHLPPWLLIQPAFQLSLLQEGKPLSGERVISPSKSSLLALK